MDTRLFLLCDLPSPTLPHSGIVRLGVCKWGLNVRGELDVCADHGALLAAVLVGAP